MRTDSKPTAAPTFVAYDVTLEVIVNLREVVRGVRKHNTKIAAQIENAASSVVANLAEGNRRTGKDRLHFFRIAAGSADETLAHLHVALAWGWIAQTTVAPALKSLDRELRLIWGLTH